MKSILVALAGIFSVLLSEPTNAGTPNRRSELDAAYVVIGAFAIQDNAVKFTSAANKSRQLATSANFRLNPERNLYYVFVLETTDRPMAIQEANRLRAETSYKDTWVYQGSFTVSQSESQAIGVDINPVTENTLSIVPPSDGAMATSTGEKAETVATTGKLFFFKLTRATDDIEVKGDVDAIDADRSRKMGSYVGNQPVQLTSPLNKTGQVLLQCDVFGYRKVQREINYAEPAGDDIASEENRGVVVPFELVRLQKGDIAVMYNVYFFKDAAIMRPESRYEVTSLMEMLKENPHYKIKIHGHTNGSATGKILSTGASKDFFSLSGTVESVGTAKKLSQARAEVIKDFLISHGIEENRMVTKAWGGRRPIHDKLSTRAHENVRVEIEILEDK